MKDDQIKETQEKVEQLHVNPQLTKFKKETKELNAFLKHQNKSFCNKLMII